MFEIPLISASETLDQQTTTLLKSSHKRKHKKDDDEDYVPPVSLQKKFITSNAVQYDSDSSIEEEPVKRTRRGRPPKRSLTISSEDCEEPIAGKYRLMRDKNNEASRKSRLKRKMKEMAHEGELQDLEERNTKLKAQVAELDRTVTNFRTNLMQILLKK